MLLLQEWAQQLANMNIFRLIGDMLHLLSIITLLLKIHATKSCRGEASTPHG